MRMCVYILIDGVETRRLSSRPLALAGGMPVSLCAQCRAVPCPCQPLQCLRAGTGRLVPLWWIALDSASAVGASCACAFHPCLLACVCACVRARACERLLVRGRRRLSAYSWARRAML
jgi:hypothetical protein